MLNAEAIEFVETVAYPTFGTILLGGLSDSRERMPLHTSSGLAYTGVDKNIESRTMVFIRNGDPVGYFNGQKIDYTTDYRSPFSVMDHFSGRIMERFGLDRKENALCFDSRNIGILSGSSDSGAAALGKALLEMIGSDMDMEAFENRLRLVSESVGRSMYGGLTLTERNGSRCFTKQILSAEEFSDIVILGCRFNEKRQPSDAIHTNIVKSPQYGERVKRTSEKARVLEKMAGDHNIEGIFDQAMDDTDEYHSLIESVGIRIINQRMNSLRQFVRKYRKRSWASYIITGGTNVFIPVHRAECESLRIEITGMCDEIVPLMVADGARTIGKSF